MNSIKRLEQAYNKYKNFIAGHLYSPLERIATRQYLKLYDVAFSGQDELKKQYGLELSYDEFDDWFSDFCSVAFSDLETEMGYYGVELETNNNNSLVYLNFYNTDSIIHHLIYELVDDIRNIYHVEETLFDCCPYCYSNYYYYEDFANKDGLKMDFIKTLEEDEIEEIIDCLESKLSDLRDDFDDLQNVVKVQDFIDNYLSNQLEYFMDYVVFHTEQIGCEQMDSFPLTYNVLIGQIAKADELYNAVIYNNEEFLADCVRMIGTTPTEEILEDFKQEIRDNLIEFTPIILRKAEYVKL